MNTDSEWLKQMAASEDGSPVSVGGLVYDLEHAYPREETTAREWGLHPDEAKPRDATFLHERRNWEKETAQLREHIAKLEAALKLIASCEAAHQPPSPGYITHEVAARIEIAQRVLGWVK